MELSQDQLAIVKELVRKAEAYGSLMNDLSENILAAWCRFVGQMREFFYMDEQWDGKEIAFSSKEKTLVKALLETDKITVYINTGETDRILTIFSTSDAADETIQMLMLKQLPERIMPTENVLLSSGNGYCALCLYNRENNEKHNRIVDLAMGFALCYGSIVTSSPCESDHKNCLIDDIGRGTPGMTAEQVTHILFPYWWAKSRFNKIHNL